MRDETLDNALSDDEIRLTVPGLPDYARIARLAVTGLAARMGYSYDEVEDLRIGVGEICNVLLAGEGDRIAFRCLWGDDALEIEATRLELAEPLEVGDLSDQILAGVFDAVTVDRDHGSVIASKRRAG